MKQELLWNDNTGGGISDGLLAFYKLNGDAIDATGNGYDGTVYGASVYTGGKLNECYKFGGYGSGDYIDITQLSSYLFPPSKFSVSVWFLTYKNNTDNQHLIQARPSAGEFSWIVTREDFVVAKITDDYFSKHGMPANANEWHHVVLMYDGSQGSFYVNGQLASWTDHDGGGGGFNNYCGLGASQRASVGNRDDEFLDGLIDHVRIYNRAITEEEVQTLYNEGL